MIIVIITILIHFFAVAELIIAEAELDCSNLRKKFQCGECEIWLTTGCRLRRHQRRHHQGGTRPKGVVATLPAAQPGEKDEAPTTPQEESPPVSRTPSPDVSLPTSPCVVEDDVLTCADFSLEELLDEFDVSPPEPSPAKGSQELYGKFNYAR